MREKINWYENRMREKIDESFVNILKYLLIIILIIIILLFLLSPITKFYIANVLLIPLLSITAIKYFRLQNLIQNSPI